MLEEDTKPHRHDVRERKMTLKLHSRTPSLLQDSASLPGIFGLTAESGFILPITPDLRLGG